MSMDPLPFSDHAPGFVATALIICFVAGWLLAVLLQRGERAGKERIRWLCGAALIAGLGVWTTHFLAMLGYRTDLPLGFDPFLTAASAIVAVAVVGVPLAVSATVTAPLTRFVLGGMAGFGISVMHAIGMGAVQECVTPVPLPTAAVGCAVGVMAFGTARSVPAIRRSLLLTSVFVVLGVCGTHFIAITGTVVQALARGSAPARDDTVLSLVTVSAAALLFIGAFLSIAIARQFEARERTHAATLSTALHHMSNGLVLFDGSSRLGLFNERFVDMFGLTADVLRPGLDLDAFLDRLGAANDWTRDKLASMGARIGAAHPERAECSMSDGRVFVIESRPVAGGGCVLTFDDVTTDRKAQSQIAHMAFHDPLTDLPNRRALYERMEEGFHPKLHFKLLLIDLDRFKAINDTFGHATGDHLLAEAARRIRPTLAPDAFFARIGGDELAVLVFGDEAQALAVANGVIAALARPFQINGIALSVTCSIGLCCTADATNAEELLKRADLALYEAKRRGRGRAFCYRPGMIEEAAERHHLEIDMRTALERRQFYLVYQPVVSLHDGQVTGYEALIRWRHPSLGLVAPARFIPIAEESDQIVSIGRWVLGEACREAMTWQQPRTIAVNLSPVQLRAPTIMADVRAALEKTGLPAERLEVEMTETALAQDIHVIAPVLAELRKLGIKIAMDDFGTGYSSLVHLRSFPLDRIKIDRSFVSTAERDRHSLAVLKAVTGMGRDLGIRTLAEGVETESELRLLRSIGCDAVQGYLTGRPDPCPNETRIQPHSTVGFALAQAS